MPTDPRCPTLTAEQKMRRLVSLDIARARHKRRGQAIEQSTTQRRAYRDGMAAGRGEAVETLYRQYFSGDANEYVREAIKITVRRAISEAATKYTDELEKALNDSAGKMKFSAYETVSPTSMSPVHVISVRLPPVDWHYALPMDELRVLAR